MADEKTEDVDALRPDTDALASQIEKAKQEKGQHPMDRPADPADHMDEDEAGSRTIRDLDKRPG